MSIVTSPLPGLQCWRHWGADGPVACSAWTDLCLLMFRLVWRLVGLACRRSVGWGAVPWRLSISASIRSRSGKGDTAVKTHQSQDRPLEGAQPTGLRPE